MRYIMRERILSWGDDFTIKDADGRDAYYIDGKVFSFGDKLSFKDMSGNELAQIKRRFWPRWPYSSALRCWCCRSSTWRSRSHRSLPKCSGVAALPQQPHWAPPMRWHTAWDF